MTPQELDFYNRQLQLAGFGHEGQERLKRASVLVAGVGGLGCPAAQYLAAAGVGRLTLADFDTVQVSNLHRQILFTMTDIGAPKAETARRRLSALNPHITIEARGEQVTEANALALVREHDVVIDATDNFATRYVLNEACVRARRPLVSAAILGFQGQLAVLNHRGGPCYRCLFPEPALETPSCDGGGVLGVLPGVLGTQQALETIKILIDPESALHETFIVYNGLTAEYRRFLSHRDPRCPSCGPDRRPLGTVARIDAATLETWLAEGRDVALLDVRTLEERERGAIAGSFHLPISALLAGEALPAMGKTLVVYCQGGARSRGATAQLLELGYADVWELAGGFLAWRDRCGRGDDTR